MHACLVALSLFCLASWASGTSQKFFPYLKPGYKSEQFRYVLKPLISTPGGRFPRAWLEPLRSLRSLRGLKAHAIPAGQEGLRQHYIARRKLVCIFEESPPSVPINEVALELTNDKIRYIMIGRIGIVKQFVENENPAQQLEYARLQREERPRGGSLAARGKRVYSSCGSRREYFNATPFSNTQLLLEIWKELLKRSISVDKATNVSDGTSKRSPRTRTLISYGKALTSY